MNTQTFTPAAWRSRLERIERKAKRKLAKLNPYTHIEHESTIIQDREKVSWDGNRRDDWITITINTYRIQFDFVYGLKESAAGTSPQFSLSFRINNNEIKEGPEHRISRMIFPIEIIEKDEFWIEIKSWFERKGVIRQSYFNANKIKLNA